MAEKLPSHLEGREGSITPEKPELGKSPGEQPKARDFFYDPRTQEILIYSKSKSGEVRERRHPFQEFLYALRQEGVRVSTGEWVDLQQALAAGAVQSLDDLYVVARAVLVKDVTLYPKFDRVFGRMFYGIGQLQPESEEEWPEEVEEENVSQEIVEPGFTEEHHGGEHIHKAIEDSRSSGHEGEGRSEEKPKSPDEGQESEQEGRGQKSEEGRGGGAGEKGRGGGGGEATPEREGQRETGGGKREGKQKQKGIMRGGKGGYSARELVVERRYESFDKDQILNYEQFSRVLSKLTQLIREASEVPSGKLDVHATVKSIAEHAGIPKLVWREEIETKPKVILLFDVGGSTDPFRPIMEKLFAAAKDCLDDVEVYYFHNAIYGEVWPQKDGDYGRHFIPLKEILKKDPDTRIIIVGDAWMAANELYDDYTDEHGNYFPSGIDSFKRIRETFDHVVWLNPIREVEHEEWDRSGTIAAIKAIFSMHDLTLRGLENAVRELMEE